MQNVSVTQRLLGRVTAGAGDPEEVTATQALDWIGATQGQIAYRGAAAWAALANGTSGQVLQTNGAAANPSWSSEPSLNGIAFPATQVSSANVNTLDDYEEGTFTPRIDGLTTAGAGTYTTQIGRYTKIGNRVTVDITLVWTAHTGTGDMIVEGLPFTSITVAGNFTVVTLAFSSWTFNPTAIVEAIPNGIILSNTTAIALRVVASNTVAQTIAIDTVATLRCSATYEVAT